ncbi:hypothetical protein PA598K_01463 [Paenibacillus sp. 598K]|nr:hypothetical protein PA598K_01463 [Paenibacillus sp. 598K]
MFQVGCMGLLRAVRHFEECRGLSFSTYAVPTIRGYMIRYIRDTQPIHYSRSVRELASKLIRDHLTDESPERIADIMGCTVALAINALSMIDVKFTSEQDVWSEDDDTQLHVDAFIDDLPRIQSQIIKLRLRGVSQSDISHRLGLSQPTVSRALQKIGKQYISIMKGAAAI